MSTEITEIHIDPVVQKRKKGRPRKTEIPKEPVGVQEKKKRGRKKKEKPIEEPKQKKKRGRKAAVKYFSSSIRKKIPLTTILQDNESNILHIDISDDDEWVNTDEQNLENNIESAEELIKEYTIIKENLENETKRLTECINNSEEEIDLPELNALLRTQIDIRKEQDNTIIENLQSVRKHEVEFEEDKQESDTSSQINRKMGYFQILSKFYDNPTWLTKTDICCWWCCHRFDSIPIGYPIEYKDKTKKFRTRGIFCSFPCMVAYGNEQHDNKIELLKYLYRKLTGESFYFNKNLESAPPRAALRMFGGQLTIDEFRNSNKNHKIYQMIEYPMVVSRDFIQEIDLAKVKSVNNIVFNSSDISRANKLNEKYNNVTHKEKNTITTGNTIDKFIKFS